MVRDHRGGRTCARGPGRPAGRWAAVGLLGLTLVLSACGGSAASSGAAPKASASAAGAGGASAKAGAPTTANAAGAVPGKPRVSQLDVAWSAPVPDMAPLWIAEQQHYFQKNGLTVNLVHINPGVQVASVVSGKTPIAVGGGAAPLEAITKGSKLLIIGTLTDQLLTTLISDKNITSVSQLRGKVVGTTAPYSVLDVALRIALRNAGLVYGKDVKVTYSANIPALVAGLQSGVVQAVMLSPPYNVQLSRMGYHVLLNMAKQNIPVAQLVAYGDATWIQAHPNATQAYLKGLVEGLRGTETYSTFWQALHQYLPNVSASDAKDVYQSYLPMWKSLVHKPNTTVAGMKAWQQQLVAQEPKIATVNLSTLIDNKPLDQLEASGFIH
jgi:ABC-type nitrate/sulfonate/bicarbonate transport system substrate-binding protein